MSLSTTASSPLQIGSVDNPNSGKATASMFNTLLDVPHTLLASAVNV